MSNATTTHSPSPQAAPRAIGIDFSNFDDRWFREAYLDFNCSASNVIIVNTADPDREQHTMFFMQAAFGENLYQFDPWHGLRKYNPGRREGDRFETVQAAAGGATAAYDAGLRNEFTDLGGALRFLDQVFRREKAGLIVRNLDGPGDAHGDGPDPANRPLIHAVRDWCISPVLTARKSLVCLISANPATVLDACTLDRTILAQPELATEEERIAMARSFAERLDGPPVDGDQLRALARAGRGLTLRQFRVVLQKVWHRVRQLDPELVKHFKADCIRRSPMIDIEEPRFGFENVGGYEPVKAIVRNTLIRALRETTRAERAAQEPPRGLLIFGPPGTGKTLFAKALAKETGLPFINFRTENLFGPLLGETGQRLRDAIHLAEQASPAIVFVDEIDRFGRRGGSGNDSAAQENTRVFSQVLEWLGDEERRSIVVGTTNLPDHLDPAFIRPKRMTYCVPFLYPDRNARLAILRIHLGLEGSRRRPVMREPEIVAALPSIAESTRLYSGADLEELVTRAKQNFFESEEEAMTAEQLLRAAQDYRIDVRERETLLDQYRNLGGRFANSVDLLEQMSASD